MLTKLNLVQRPARLRFSGWFVSVPFPRRLGVTRDPIEGCSGLGKECARKVGDKKAFRGPRGPVINKKITYNIKF